MKKKVVFRTKSLQYTIMWSLDREIPTRHKTSQKTSLYYSQFSHSSSITPIQLLKFQLQIDQCSSRAMAFHTVTIEWWTCRRRWSKKKETLIGLTSLRFDCASIAEVIDPTVFSYVTNNQRMPTNYWKHNGYIVMYIRICDWYSHRPQKLIDIEMLHGARTSHSTTTQIQCE